MAPINAVVLAKTFTSKLASIVTNAVKRTLKDSSQFKKGHYDTYEDLPFIFKMNYSWNLYWWRTIRYKKLAGWSIKPFKPFGIDWTLYSRKGEVSEAMANSWNKEDISRKKAERIFTDSKKQNDLIEVWLDVIANLLNGLLSLGVIYYVYYWYEEQSKLAEKKQKAEQIENFRNLQQRTDENFARISRIETQINGFRKDLEELRPSLLKLMILLQAQQISTVDITAAQNLEEKIHRQNLKIVEIPNSEDDCSDEFILNMPETHERLEKNVTVIESEPTQR